MPISQGKIQHVRIVLVWLRRQLLYLYWQFTHFLGLLRISSASLHFFSRWFELYLNSLTKLTVTYIYIKRKYFLDPQRNLIYSVITTPGRGPTLTTGLWCEAERKHISRSTHISQFLSHPSNRLMPGRTVALGTNTEVSVGRFSSASWLMDNARHSMVQGA